MTSETLLIPKVIEELSLVSKGSQQRDKSTVCLGEEKEEQQEELGENPETRQFTTKATVQFQYTDLEEKRHKSFGLHWQR